MRIAWDLAAELAGYFAAHAFRCVFDGETLIPLIGWETPDYKRKMRRLMADTIEQGVREGQDQLTRNSEGAARAVLVYGGFITLPTGEVNALLIDIHDYSSPSWSLLMAVPYQPASPQEFRVHRPKFLSFAGPEPDYQAVTSAFFQGWTIMRRLRQVGVDLDR